MTSHLQIDPTDATCGAIVTGVRIASLDEETWPEIEAAFHERGVLIFPGQFLTVDQQAGFAQRFGEIEYLDDEQVAKVLPLGNSAVYGTRNDGDFIAKILKGNEDWHIDSSYMPLAAKASVLSAVILPSAGGQTEWADMCAAYESLDEESRGRIAGLSAYHSYFHSQALIGHTVEVGAGHGFYAGEKPLRPLVKEHPVTGRSALYVGRHAYGVPGLTEAESEKLLSDLQEFVCRPPRTFMHEWCPGDVAIWDNRRVLHRARPYDSREPRLMYHTRIAGDPETELAAGMTL